MRVKTTTVARLVRRTYMAWNALNDLYLNIETDYSVSGPGAERPGYMGVETDRARYRDNVRYVGLDYVRIRRMMKVLAPEPDDVVYDIGSGKGRLLCSAARRRVKKVVGVELFEELCADARVNAARLRGKLAPISVICADATTVDYSEGTVFTMFLPFGESRKTNPRHVRIGYAHPLHESVFEEASWLEKYATFRNTDRTNKNFWRSVSFWRSKDPERPCS